MTLDGGEVVVVLVTPTCLVVANNAVEGIVPTLARSDNAMSTDGTCSNPALTLRLDRIFLQPCSGGVINGLFTTNGSIRVRSAVRIVAEGLRLRRE